MASPPSLLQRLRPPPCSRRRSKSLCLHLSKQSLHPFPSPRNNRRPVAASVVEQLVPRLPETGRRTGRRGNFACRCSYGTENGPPSPPPDKEKRLDEWPVLRRWDVPWKWSTISLTMVACAIRQLSSDRNG
uniref:Uncharacterized protein n=1 Tax=Arundo donax TaxID=35708 RepID=A0A0A9DQI3_ARUDO